MVAAPMSQKDWAAILQEGELLYWFGGPSFRRMGPKITIGSVFFLIIGVVFAEAAFGYSTVEDFCGIHPHYSCARFFALRWLGVTGSFGLGLTGLFAITATALGWLRHSYAVTDHRALWIIKAPWHAPPGKLYEADLVSELPRLDGEQVKFGTSPKGVRFMGLNPKQREIVYSLAIKLGRAKQT